MITKNIGGSNIFQYDLNDPNSGLITKYATNQPQIDAVLDQLRANQDCIQLILLLSQTPPSGVYIPFSGQTMSLNTRMNFIRLLNSIATKDFKFVGIVPEFWHVDDFRLNNLTQDQIFGHFVFLQWLQGQLDKFSFDWCIDLCAELDNSPGCINNAKLLWTWWTETYFPNAAPCWNATMSLIPQIDYSFIADIFRGENPNGAPNWPARINLHAYRNEAQSMLDGLHAVGMPDRNIYWGECFTLVDSTEDIHARDIHEVILNNRNMYTFERIIQYPIRVNQIGDPEVNVLPTSWRY